MGLSRITGYLTKKAEELKKAVLGEDETPAKKPAETKSASAPVKLVSDQALEQDANMGLGVEKTTTPTQPKEKIAEQVKSSGAETPVPAQPKTSTPSRVDNQGSPTAAKTQSQDNLSKEEVLVRSTKAAACATLAASSTLNEGLKYINKSIPFPKQNLSILLNFNQKPYAYKENNEQNNGKYSSI